MRKLIAITLVLALCLGMLTAAIAEGGLKQGWKVEERKTPMFERLPDVHYGPESVVEYDAEHFAVFSDPETGYWGVGLKAEYYPEDEGDTFSFENAAVIVLGNIGYDNDCSDKYDLRISIDRVTYASLEGTAVNADADVLGVFGYSRDMETIGLLSGWGGRAQRDENGVKLQDGEVWLVEDAAAYDTYGLCTEVELSVTAVRKNGREIDPKYVGRTKWIAADLDMLQADVTAEGYEPHYFDEQLILKDGFVYGYFVQQGHVLNIEGKVRVNDSIMGSGVKTGLHEDELPKRFAAVQLQQDKTTAHVNWRGCGSEEAPARTELLFIGAEKIVEKPTNYTVMYLEEGTDIELAGSKSVKGKTVGSKVTESAIEIENYDLVSESALSITLEKNADQNVIKFYYKKPAPKLTVTYVVNPDKIWGTPEGSKVPTDSNKYNPNDYVKVEDQLTTKVDYAYNEKGEKVKGTWEFVTWDKDDFYINQDTTITGGWVFTPAPVKTYKYTVHYKLYDGSIQNAKTVNSDTEGTVNALGDKVDIDAIAVKSLDHKQYRNVKKYKIRGGFEHVTVTITHDNYEITIWYELVSHGM